LTIEERKRANRAIRRRLSAGAGPGTIAEILIQTSREVSGRNPAVGPNLLVSSVLRDRLPAEMMLAVPGVHLPPDWTENVFRYVAGDLDESTAYAPGWACDGIAMVNAAVTRVSEPSPAGAWVRDPSNSSTGTP
jgi:hypothetical protein